MGTLQTITAGEAVELLRAQLCPRLPADWQLEDTRYLPTTEEFAFGSGLQRYDRMVTARKLDQWELERNECNAQAIRFHAWVRDEFLATELPAGTPPCAPAYWIFRYLTRRGVGHWAAAVIYRDARGRLAVGVIETGSRYSTGQRIPSWERRLILSPAEKDSIGPGRWPRAFFLG